MDFDCDGCVAGGDLGWFAGGWLRTCDQLDAISDYPPCRECPWPVICPAPAPGPGQATSAGALAVADEDSTLVLLTVHLSRDVGSVGELDEAGPVALDSIKTGEHVFAEVWVKDASPSSEGLTAVFADVSYDPRQFTVVAVDPGEIFTLFSHPAVVPDVGMIRQLGGATMEANYGAGQWARVAIVELEALADLDMPTIALCPSAGHAISSRGRGLIPNDRIVVVPGTHRVEDVPAVDRSLRTQPGRLKRK